MLFRFWVLTNKGSSPTMFYIINFAFLRSISMNFLKLSYIPLIVKLIDFLFSIFSFGYFITLWLFVVAN